MEQHYWKAIAERVRILPEEARIWYSIAPKIGSRTDTMQQRSVFLIMNRDTQEMHFQKVMGKDYPNKRGLNETNEHTMYDAMGKKSDYNLSINGTS